MSRKEKEGKEGKGEARKGKISEGKGRGRNFYTDKQRHTYRHTYR